MTEILVTGGAGYIGSVLVRLLLANGYAVRVMDNLRFGGESIVDLLNNPQFSFVKGDIRSAADCQKAAAGVEAVCHLAAIVGDPACAKDPDLARATNLEGGKALYEAANRANVKKFIFASTCSNYGKMKDPDSFVNENSELSPVSLYAETKVAFEQFLLSQPVTNVCKPTCLRFSTVYGLSSRIRFDLTVNEFARDLALGRELKIFGEQFWRPYCHVVDLARSMLAVLTAPASDTQFDVFNVGDTAENYQKKMIVDEILKIIPDGKVSYVQKTEDPRDYRVNFSKIQERLGFKITMRVPDGIRQIVTSLRDGFIVNPDDQRYRNVD